MSLSVCTVTRNEEKNLARMLRSVAGLAEEAVVAETGSTDRTAAIAEELGAKVRPFAWDDDFAAARNFAIDQATGDWVLWLNPDEELLPAGMAVVRQCIARNDALAFAARVQELVRADRPDAFTELRQVRLFRRRPELRYVGRLHPDFSPPIGTVAQQAGLQVYASDIVVRRHAYLSQLDEGKLRWAVRLLERELKDRPGQLHFQIEYGRTLLLLNDPRGHEVLGAAVEQLLPLRDAPAAPTATVAVLLAYLLTVSPGQSRSRLGREEARELARRWFPNSPPLLWQRAEHEFQAGNFRPAAELLGQLVRLGQTGDYDHSLSFDPSIIGPSALLNLGACYTRLRDLDRAEQCFLTLAGNPAFRDQALQNLAVVHNLRQQAAPGAGS
jgi:hypothetical protein